MTVQEFDTYLSDLGQELTSLQDVLATIGAETVAQMKFNVPVDTGRLSNSIRYALADDSLSFEMLYYGPFQNYGVTGLAGPRVTPVPAYGVEQPSVPPFYAFKSRSFGFNPHPFFDIDRIQLDIADAIVNIIEET